MKQANPQEWSSPPWEAQLVDLPNLGKVVMGRGAVNQKGPQSAFLAALHAIRAAGRKIPVNLVLVAEGEEEIGSPHFPQVVLASPVREALAKCEGIFMPEAAQDLDGNVTVSLGAKGIAELELVASGEKWGRGPAKDVHSSNRARLDSPAWHLVQALNTLIDANGDPAIDGYMEGVRPPSAAESKMLDDAAMRIDENTAKKSMGVKQWARNASWRQALQDLAHRPTVNIEGLVGGYTGQGGMTILPHRAAAKLDLRLVPDMTHKGAVEKLQGASREARLRRHRSQRHRRLRSDDDAGGRAADQGRIAGLSCGRDRADLLAASRRLLAGLRVHGRSAEARRGAFRPRPRHARARAGRVFPDRVAESEVDGAERRDPVVRGLPVRDRVSHNEMDCCTSLPSSDRSCAAISRWPEAPSEIALL